MLRHCQKYKTKLSTITEKDPVSILILLMLKLIIDYVEANKDGEPRYQNVTLKHFLCEKDNIVNHAMEIVKSIVERFDKCYGTTITETSEATINVYVDKGNHLLLGASQILNCNVWPDLTEIGQYATQIAAFQKLFDCFKEMAIYNGVTSTDITESFQATIWYAES